MGIFLYAQNLPCHLRLYRIIACSQVALVSPTWALSSGYQEIMQSLFRQTRFVT